MSSCLSKRRMSVDRFVGMVAAFKSPVLRQNRRTNDLSVIDDSLFKTMGST